MIRTTKGYFAALACEKVLNEHCEVIGKYDDPMTDYYGAQGIVSEAQRRAERIVLRRYGFRDYSDVVAALYHGAMSGL